jgi:small nuclear ribonucleoprotein (snRNP)-like protein
MEAGEFSNVLSDFYKKVDPGKLGNVPVIVKKYLNNQDHLLKFLEKKYGCPVKAASGSSGDPTPSSDVPPHLDVHSKSFDPAAALSVDCLRIPFPNAKPLDRLFKFRLFLPHDHDDYDGRIHLGKSKSTKRRDEKNPERKPFQAYTDALAESFKKGPLSILRRCMAEKRRVVVHIRRFKGIKGTCVGFLEAFDRHCNMVLSDVHEDFLMFDHYRTVVSTPTPTCPKKKQWKEPVLKPRKRYFKRLFLRGDNVVLVGLGE